MPPELHRDPERLRPHAATAVELADALEAALCGSPALEAVGAGHAAELDRLQTAVVRAVRELRELGAALVVAAMAETVDAEVAAALRRAAQRP